MTAIKRTLLIRSAVLAILMAGFVMLTARPAEARYASIVIDVDTATVLHERNADTRNYPASLAKLMTLYLVFEALDQGDLRFDQRLHVSRRAAGQAPSRLGLSRGQTISVEDSILALVTKSANDVATVVAEALAGTESEFARLMTRKARALGMKHSTFRNASGLPNRKQLATARDMSTLAVALIRDFPHYYDYFSVRQFTYGSRTYRNHNKLLDRYSGADGMKTGYIHASGFNLVASAKRGRTRLVVVVFGGKTARSRDAHTAKLLDRGFAKLAAANGSQRPKVVSVPGDTNGVMAGREAPKAGLAPVIPVLKPRPWGIQLGAYHSVAVARTVLETASFRLPRLLAYATLSLTPVERDGRTLYRARYLALSEVEARVACRELETASMPCTTVREADPPPARRLSRN